MSSSLDYRPPHFSEELAWLPSWFQQQHFQPLEEEKDLGYEFMNKCTREDVIIPLEDEGRYKSCHLFLSGEDMPSASLCSSSTNVGGFRLYLSPDGTSQDLYSSGLGTFRAGNMGSDYVVLVQKTELTASQEVRGNQCSMDHDAQETSTRPLTSKRETLEHACLQSLERNNDMKMENQDTVKIRNVSEISEVVEHSIAAAEALVICDMVKSSSSTKSLPAAAILEVALRVKQARLEGPEDGSYRSEEDSDIDESMSDFHESDMADALEDVGLIVCGSDDLIASAADISQVKETPNSEIHSLNVSPFDTFTEQEPTKNFDMDNQERKNLAVELLDFDGKRKLKDKLTSGLTPASKVPNNDIGLRWSVAERSNVPAVSEELYLPLENMTPPQKKAKEICAPHAEGSVNDVAERDDKLHLYGSIKFQSRWLGGWMRKKEMNASASVACNNSNLIPKLLVDETSYLSESADVASDMNSHVQIRDEGFHLASQPSILFNGLPDGADEGVNVSPDTGIPSCLSLTDPLCSVVPCSLSSAHTCPSRIHDSNYVEDTEECLRLASENCNDILRRTSISNAGEQHTVLKINGEASHSTIRRQLTSLRTYSMLLPQCSSFLEKDRNYGKPPTSPNSSRLLSTEKNSCARGVQENHETSNKIKQVEPETLVYIEKEVLPETQVHIEKGRCSARILNRRKHHRVSACKMIDHDSDRSKALEKAPIPKCGIALRNGNLQKVHLKCGVAHDPEIPARKRVRFAEAGTQALQKTNVLKQFSSTECLATRAGKKINSSNGQRVKKPQSNFPHKNAKRLIFRNLEFLLTGFPEQKEREFYNLIRKHGGTVLPGIPSPNLRGRRTSRLVVQQHPVVLCPHKLETTEFLYGCVVNAFILRVDWLTDSVKAGSALAPDKYMVISNHEGEGSLGKSFCRDKHNFIFDGVGVMLLGKHRFCTRLATVIKHGGGKVFKTLQLMVQNLDTKMISSGIIVAEDELNVSRHLKHCASERKIHTMTASWIINSLHFGKLLPFAATIHSSCLPTIKILDFPDPAAFSEEI